MKRRRALFASLVLALLGVSRPVGGQGTGPLVSGAAGASETAYAPVKVEGRKLFDVTGSAALSAAQRAEKIGRRLQSLIERKQDISPFTARDLIRQDKETLITLGGEPILSVTQADAQESLTSRDELALLWGGKLAVAVRDARAARANPLQGVGILLRNSFQDLLVSIVKWLPRLVGAVILWVFFLFLARFVRWVAQAVTRRTGMDANMRQLLRAVSFYGTWIVGLIALLSTLGLDSAGIAAGLGISGFVLGFAFKDILSHFFAGLMLLIGRQFHIGDQIVVKEFEGTVERIELRALYLRTYDNRLVIIPNGDVFTSTVTSNTASPYRRRDFLVGIGYQDAIEKAQRIGLQAMLETEGVLTDPAPDVLVDELTASTVNLRLRFYANSQRADYLKVGSACMKRVKEAFDREGISMPTDIQTVILQNAMPDGPPEAGRTTSARKETA